MHTSWPHHTTQKTESVELNLELCSLHKHSGDSDVRDAMDHMLKYHAY